MEATKLELTEEQFFRWTAEHPEALSPKFDGSYTNRQARLARATAWFVEQFSVDKLHAALGATEKCDPDGPMDLAWLIARLRETAAHGKPGIKLNALARLREYQRIGAAAHPSARELSREPNGRDEVDEEAALAAENGVCLSRPWKPSSMGWRNVAPA